MIRVLIPLITTLVFTEPLVAVSQENLPDLSAFSSETRKSYIDTQKFIKKTQTKMNLARSQANARAKEIEALAIRVSDIITKMSGQGEDNSALQSEIYVLNELLALERKTSGDLRLEMTKLSSTIKNIRLNNNMLKNKYSETLEKNKNLAHDIEGLKAVTGHLSKQVRLLKKRRYGSPIWKNTPK